MIGIIGSTASGKTGLAIEVCRAFDGEILGADASQVYRGMQIGTGQASEAELAGCRHHLVDVVNPDEPFDLAAYVGLADAVIGDIQGRGRNVVLCGGTGLYLRGLVHGVCEAPPASPEVRADLRAKLEAGQVEALHAELALVDPVSARRMKPRDGQRIERALGVFRSHGRPLSEWQAAHGFNSVRYPVAWVGLRWPRARLVERIEQRIDCMLEAGWVEEVQRLVADGYGANLRSMRALGYGFIAQHLAGELSLDEAREKTLIATRQYARRQMTWFKKMDGVTWFDAPICLDEVLQWIEKTKPWEGRS